MINTKVIIDTNVLVAIIDEKDKWHKFANEIREALKESSAKLIFFDCVINEAISVIGRRLEEKGLSDNFSALITKIESLIPAKSITWVSARIEKEYPHILNLVKKHKGELNFHDALIAIVAKEKEIKHIASFDSDFDQIDWLTRIKDNNFTH